MNKILDLTHASTDLYISTISEVSCGGVFIYIV